MSNPFLKWALDHIPASLTAGDPKAVNREIWSAHSSLWQDPRFRLLIEDLWEDVMFEPGWLDGKTFNQKVPTSEEAMFKAGQRSVLLRMLNIIKRSELDVKETK